MKLKELLNNVVVKNDISTFEDLQIENISLNAQNKMKNGLFFCFSGKNDGYKLASVAIQNGAKVIVCEHSFNIDNKVHLVIVNDIRETIAVVSQNFYKTKDAKVIGITGTNGKTTTSFIIKNILEKAGKRVGVIGTNGIYFQNEFIEATLTTPDPVDLHHIFSIMMQGKVDYIIMEVSAHAIELKKVLGINFVCKIFTNLSQDHLDYFKTMEHYSSVKESFFTNDDMMVVNIDDTLGQKIANKYETAITYGLKNPCDAFCVEINQNCTKYTMNICDNVIDISSNLYGLFNVYNTLAGAVCCYFLGVSVDNIKSGIESIKKIDGRFNVIEYNERKIIIDFAHTPDGLENVLKTARKITDGRLYSLFGCGGNRDKKKRKIMGAISNKYANFTFITSDNPRYENPLNIIDEIAKGFNDKSFYKVEDRKNAIKMAIMSLKEGDTLLICGKGAENYIDINGKKIPYSDYEVVKKVLGELK